MWDILELVDGRGHVRVAYVVDHVDGVAPDPGEFGEVIGQLRELCAKDDAVLVSGSGWKGVDFQLPDGNGNVITDVRDGRPKYIDVHSFRILCADLGLEPAQDSSQNGEPADPLLVRTVKRAQLGWNASATSGAEGLERLLRTAGASFNGKLVLDTTGRFEPALLDCLRFGAAWLHAWVAPEDLGRAEEALLRSGLTRASFAAAPRSSCEAVSRPPHLERFAAHQTVVRHSSDQLVNWRRGFADLPWSIMLYEHGDGADLKAAMNELGAARRRGQDDVAGLDGALRRVAFLES